MCRLGFALRECEYENAHPNGNVLILEWLLAIRTSATNVALEMMWWQSKHWITVSIMSNTEYVSLPFTRFLIRNILLASYCVSMRSVTAYRYLNTLIFKLSFNIMLSSQWWIGQRSAVLCCIILFFVLHLCSSLHSDKEFENNGIYCLHD